MDIKQKIAKIEQLKTELNSLNVQVSNEQGSCSHNWSEAFYDPTTKREPSDYKLVGHGSDVYYEPTGYHDIQVPRWSRTCTKCALKQTTTEQKPVNIKYEPSFPRE